MGIYVHQIELQDGTVLATAITTNRSAPTHQVSATFTSGEEFVGGMPLEKDENRRGFKTVWVAKMPEVKCIEVLEMESLFSEDEDAEGWARFLS